MYDINYLTLCRYIKSLSNRGYIKGAELKKILYINALFKITQEYFPKYITDNDFRDLEHSLYYILGSSCNVPYIKLIDGTTMNKLHLRDAHLYINYLEHKFEDLQSDFADKFEEQKNEIHDDISNIKATKVLKSEQSEEITVDDIII